MTHSNRGQSSWPVNLHNKWDKMWPPHYFNYITYTTHCSYLISWSIRELQTKEHGTHCIGRMGISWGWNVHDFMLTGLFNKCMIPSFSSQVSWFSFNAQSHSLYTNKDQHEITHFELFKDFFWKLRVRIEMNVVTRVTILILDGGRVLDFMVCAELEFF